MQIRFSADDVNAVFSCSVDGAPPAPCDPPLALARPALGRHTVRVGAVDAAGNIAEPAVSSFDVVPAPVPPAPPAPPTPGPLVPSGVVAAIGPAPAPAAGSTCAPPGRPGVTGVRWGARGRSLVLRLAAAGDARYVRVSIRSERSSLPQRLGRPLQAILLPGRATQVTWRLQRWQLPPRGRAGFALAVSVARCRTAFGPRVTASLPRR